MNNPLRLAAIGIAAAALAACSGAGSSVPGIVHGPAPSNQSHVVLQSVPGLDLTKVHVMKTVQGQKSVGVIPNAAQTLTYFGGNVLTKPAVYVVYWGFGKRGSDGAGEQKYLTNFLTGVGGSTWESLLTQYYQNGPVYITNPSGQLKGTWVDSSSIPTHPTDAQIQAEAAKAVTHFGYSANASYVVATSHGHNTLGFGSSFCAYHGFTSGSASYTNLPYIHDAGASCGENFVNGGTKGNLDGVSIVEGHEYAESITDPNPPTGWYNNSYGEIGDICAWMKPPAGDIVLSTGSFAVQGLWSNQSSACKINGP